MSNSSDWKEPNGKKSEVWKHVLVKSGDDSVVKCKYCSAKFNPKQATTSLIYHLQKKEGISLKKSSEPKEVDGKFKQKQLTIQSCLQKKDCAEVVLARLLAVDLLPMYKLEKSKDIQNGWAAQGLKIPTTRKAMKKMFLSFTDKIKTNFKQELAAKISDKDRFSISLDEWTSIKNQRYMGLNLHLNDATVQSLGMVRIKGSMTAENGLDLVKKRLEDFGLTLQDHIVGMVTDGASVMVKTGRLSGIIHQICHSHGLHLAVCDVLYKKRHNEEDTNEAAKAHEYDIVESSDDEDDDEPWQVTLPDDYNADFVDTVSDTISKVRAIVKLFRKSPLKNDCLQKNCEKELGKTLSLLLDTKTRWNSLLKMLTRFLEARAPLDNTLKELDLGSKCLTDDEVAVVKDLAESLEIIEVGATALCRRDVTVSKSEKIFEYVLKKLTEETGAISQELLTAVTDRVESRRNKGICGLVRYLEAPNSYEQVVESSLLSYPKKRELAKVARDVFSRLFPNGSIDESAEDLKHFITGEPPMKKSKEEELNDILCQTEDQHLDRVQENVLTHIKREMTFYEATKECPKVLKRLKSCLNSLPPSSVEAERCFSAAGLFISKLRSSLSDGMIDSLCFARSYFVRK